jgi:hypothetical protein
VEVAELVERFAAGAGVLGTAIEGLSAAEINARPVPGKWSLRQLVLHVLDSDLIATHRMKRIIAEDTPLLISDDETPFAEKLYGERLDVPLACELFRLNRLQMAEILRETPEPAFARTGVHSQRGKVTLREQVELYIGHLDHHMKFAREKRAALGKG